MAVSAHVVLYIALQHAVTCFFPRRLAGPLARGQSCYKSNALKCYIQSRRAGPTARGQVPIVEGHVCTLSTRVVMLLYIYILYKYLSIYIYICITCVGKQCMEGGNVGGLGGLVRSFVVAAKGRDARVMGGCWGGGAGLWWSPTKSRQVLPSRCTCISGHGQKEEGCDGAMATHRKRPAHCHVSVFASRTIRSSRAQEADRGASRSKVSSIPREGCGRQEQGEAARGPAVVPGSRRRRSCQRLWVQEPTWPAQSGSRRACMECTHSERQQVCCHRSRCRERPWPRKPRAALGKATGRSSRSRGAGDRAEAEAGQQLRRWNRICGLRKLGVAQICGSRNLCT